MVPKVTKVCLPNNIINNIIELDLKIRIKVYNLRYIQWRAENKTSEGGGVHNH